MKYFVVLLLATFILCVLAKEKTIRLVKEAGGLDYPQDITYDADKKIVIITVGDPEGSPESFVPTTNFHDYNSNFVVFKDITRDKCFLAVPPLPFAVVYFYEVKRTSLDVPLIGNVNTTVIPNDILADMAGDLIADFCEDYKTYWMELTHAHSRDIWKRSAGSDACLFNCGVCSLHVRF